MSLQRRWFILLALFFAFVVGILCWIFLQLNRNSLKDAAIEKYKHFSLYIAQNVSEYLVLSNFATVERTIVSDLRSDSEVLYFFYTNINGEMLYSLDDNHRLTDFVDTNFVNPIVSTTVNLTRISSPNAKFEIRETKLLNDVVKNGAVVAKKGEKIYEIFQECQYSEQTLGHFRLGISTSDVDLAIKNQVTRIFIIALVLILFGLIIIHYYSMRLLRPVHELTNKLQTIINPRSDQTLEAQIKQFHIEDIDDRTTELQSLKEAFIAFKTNLLNSISKINQLNRVESMVLTVQMLAHDLRRPFSQLKMLLQSDDNQREHLKKGFVQVQGSIDQIDSMMKDLMDFSKERIDLKPTVLSEVLKIVTTQVQSSLRGTQIQIQTQIPENISVLADPEKLGRVFSNLISNAIEAILEIGKSKQGSVQINATKQSEKVIIEVHNSGPPIPTEQLEFIFDLFFTQGKTKGTGLGLAIVHKLVDLHKGKISARNENGVTFTVELLTADLISPAWQETLRAEETVYTRTALKNKVALHLEDEELYRSGMRNLFTGYSDWDLLEASSMTEAQKIIENQKVDIVLIDVDLGVGPSGVDFAQWLFQKNPKAEIFFHTNRATTEIPPQWRGRVISKPMSQETLKSILGLV